MVQQRPTGFELFKLVISTLVRCYLPFSTLPVVWWLRLTLYNGKLIYILDIYINIVLDDHDDVQATYSCHCTPPWAY